MEETAGSSVWAALITAREKTLARDRRGLVGDQGVLVTEELRGLLGPLGTGDMVNGSGGGRLWGRAGGTDPPAVLGGVCGNTGDTVSQEGAVEMRGQVCTEPAEREVSGAAPSPRESPAAPSPGGHHGSAAAEAAAGSPAGTHALAPPGLVPAGEPSSIGCGSPTGAAGGSVGLAGSFSEGGLRSGGRTGDWTGRLGLVQPRSAAQGRQPALSHGSTGATTRLRGAGGTGGSHTGTETYR